mgnify:FL=1
MKIGIIGDGLISLILANVIALKGLKVVIFSNNKPKKYSQTRTVGITKSNIDYINKNIVNIDKNLWKIKKIKIFSENFNKGEILNFSNSKEQTFATIKNNELYEIIKKNLIINKFINFKKNFDYKKIIKENYNLLINCELNNPITKKFFSKRIEKKYNSFAYTTIIEHKKSIKNDIAFQIFTNNGPIAFLPISYTQTSIVYSYKTRKNLSEILIKKLIHKFNPIYKITKVGAISKFALNSSNLRNYYKANILAFGDLLHKVHPLAGQGFNMSLRDIRCLSNLIDDHLNLGLTLDKTICFKFESEIKDKNFIFSTGIDWIYEFFNFESKMKNELLSKSLNILGKNKIFNSFFKKFADTGLNN